MDYVQTYMEEKFQFLDPTPGSIRIEDIAHSLSMLCRYNGHCTQFYSVAQHSVHVAGLVPPELRLEALLHDAAEAYIGDLASPIKEYIPAFREMERGIRSAVHIRFGIIPTAASLKVIKEADLISLSTEARDNMTGPCTWAPREPDFQQLIPLTPHEAEWSFRGTFLRLGGE